MLSVFLILFCAAILTFLSFDGIVRFQYKKFRTDWVSDGESPGFFWMPPTKDFAAWQRSLVRGSFIRSKLFCRWVFFKPEWAQFSRDATPKFLIFRLCLQVNFLILPLN